MQHTGMFHGGLVFYGDEDLGIEKATELVADTLEAFCQQIDRRTALSNGRARVTSARWMVKLATRPVPQPTDSERRRARLDAVGHLIPDDAADWPQRRLVVTFCAADPTRVDEDNALRLLAETLRRLVLASDPRFVEWRTQDRLVPAQKFAAAMAQLSLPKCAGADDPPSRFGPVDSDARRLSVRYDEYATDDPKQSRTLFDSLGPELALAYALNPPEPAQRHCWQRLAIWGLTGVIATVSGPVGLSVAAVNVLRGEDMRLNSHVLALTVSIGTLSSSGALASVISTLPN